MVTALHYILLQQIILHIMSFIGIVSPVTSMISQNDCMYDSWCCEWTLDDNTQPRDTCQYEVTLFEALPLL